MNRNGRRSRVPVLGGRAHVWMPAAAVAIAAVVAACSPAPRAADNAALADQSLDSLRAAVLELIGEPTAASMAQCRLIGFGAKPCGGPSSYLLYSMETTDSTSLARAVATYNAEAGRANRESGGISNCRVETPPGLAFASGRCEITR